jgi:hypothetical protein
MDLPHYTIKSMPNVELFIRQENWGFMVVRRDLGRLRSGWSRRFADSDEMAFSFSECNCQQWVEGGRLIKTITALDAAISYMSQRSEFSINDLPIYDFKVTAKQAVVQPKVETLSDKLIEERLKAGTVHAAFGVDYAKNGKGEKPTPLTTNLLHPEPTPQPNARTDKGYDYPAQRTFELSPTLSKKQG